jgi:CRISPR-associated endonuclease Csn1
LGRNQGTARLTFGFDIGIASVGWSVLAEDRIVDLGVRCFDAAEVPKSGTPLNEQRRLARGARTRLARRAWRLKRLRRLLKAAGLVETTEPVGWIATASAGSGVAEDPWSLRCSGLDRRLLPHEWARVLYHLVKHRGFHAARRAEASSQPESEGGRLSQGVQRTEALMRGKWRTLGEMAVRDEAFAANKRNKAGSYDHSFSRALLAEELALLFEQQRRLGNMAADSELEQQVSELLWFQKPALDGEAMLAMIGRCTFEPEEYRCPKQSFTAERFVWLSRLNNLRVIDRGQRRALTPGERAAAMPLPYQRSKVTYRQLRKAIGLDDSPHVGFAGLSYGSRRNKKGEFVDPEEATLVEMKGWHQMRSALVRAGLEDRWQSRATAALSGDDTAMDSMARALAICKSDEELRPALVKAGAHPDEAEALLELNVSGFLQLSLKALGRLLPHLESGLRFDEAKTACGYVDRQELGPSRLLPDWPHHFAVRRGKRIKRYEIGNPVVMRSLHQARKVLNALIETYGSPIAVHVELARDLSKPFDERKDIERGQQEFQVEKQRAFDFFVEQVARHPQGDELLKMRLYREQDGQCAYSQQPLAPFGDLRQMFDACEIDHVLPYSRSFDDSQNNKVLVLARENREKGNRTPYEYLDGANEGERWRRFEAWVLGHKQLRKAKRDRLLRKHFGDEESQDFRNRNLVDTRYVTRAFADYVRHRLLFAPDAGGAPRPNPVVYPAGSLTSFLRARWGLVKDRQASDLHHALDACVIAAVTPALVKRVSDFSRRAELVQLTDGSFADRLTGEILSPEVTASLGERFPQPWPHFRDEVLARLSTDPAVAIGERFPAYDAQARSALRAVFVSRPPKRRARGALHEETVRSVKSHLGAGKTSVRVRLERLTSKQLGQIVGAEDPRNAALMLLLKHRLEAHGGDGKKAFGPNTPAVHKPLRDGTPGPRVLAVKVADTQHGGVRVRGGVAAQASIWRVDVFRKGGKHYLVPVYASDRRKGAGLPNRAATAGTPPSDWTLIDDSFEFRFSLFPDDLVRFENASLGVLGYFAGMNVNTASITLRAPDRDRRVGKDGEWRSLGVKMGVKVFEKLHVDVLGRVHRTRAERRGELA